MRRLGVVFALLLSLPACGVGSEATATTTPSQSDSATETTSPVELPEVPALVSSSLADAKADARDVGMRVVVVGREFSSEPMGSVLEQSVSAGTEADEGGTIEVVIAVHPKVPSLVGLSLAEARDRLRSLSLRLGSVTRKASTAERGDVLSQRPPARERVPAGSRVRVTIVSPHLCGSPLNPWCFSVSGGSSLIYDAPAELCFYIDCISSFSSYSNGYVIQCADGEFSHSGGVSGSCSWHGGNWRPLYRP